MDEIRRLAEDLSALRQEQQEQQAQYARLQTQLALMQGSVREHDEFQDRIQDDQRAMRRDLGDLRDSLAETVRCTVADYLVLPSRDEVRQQELDYVEWNAMRDGAFERAVKRNKLHE
jgi:septal ring factor EnvC (AmiA/AmiB activator)